ncbi:MAG TPA: 16S rRNA (cytidine(1402)-2'-O)-methyltransferase [Bacteroidales bacterium]|nr:16S rRNA (cytidine(1402)-2'-O)-methyltransferase [Bacteroidales bacterium]
MSKLYIVPTPIGNLEDITLRAIRVLKEVSLVLAEDTRTTKKLFLHYNINTPLQSYHIFNEHQKTSDLAVRIESGEIMAIVSDAGTPSVSDPGFMLVRACIEKNIEVECLPGPTALIPALVNSGFPSDKFCFEGFLPHKKGRKTRIHQLADEHRTIILYESPHRLLRTLNELKDAMGAERMCSVSRELSKIHEENIRGSFDQVIAHFSKNAPRGEFVIVIASEVYNLET